MKHEVGASQKIKSFGRENPMRRTVVAIGIILAVFALGTSVRANEEPDIKAGETVETHQTGASNPSASIAEQATDPSAVLTQMGFFFWSTTASGNDDGDSETFLFQPVLPLTKTNVLRPALPIIGSAEPGRKTGFGDLFILDAFFFQTKKSTLGVGPVASLPTASRDEFGTGKFSVGANFIWIYKGIKKNLSGILIYPMFSVAGDGDREDVSNLTFQLIWVRHFPGWYFAWTDITGVVDFEDDNRLTFPLGFRFGKVFKAKHPWNMVMEPYYTYQGNSEKFGSMANDYGVKFGFTLILPELMKH